VDCTKSGADYSDFNEACSYKTMEYLGIDTAPVKKCTQEEAQALLSKQIKNHAWSPL